MSNRYPLRVRAVLQVTRVLLMFAITLCTGLVVAAITAVAGGSDAAYALGIMAGGLLACSPEICQLVVLRIDESRSGPIRIQDLRLSLRTAAEFVPGWHPDSATADRSR